MVRQHRIPAPGRVFAVAPVTAGPGDREWRPKADVGDRIVTVRPVAADGDQVPRGSHGVVIRVGVFPDEEYEVAFYVPAEPPEWDRELGNGTISRGDFRLLRPAPSDDDRPS